MFFGRRVPNISSSELAGELKAGSALLIDVREPSEFAAGHVPSAVNLPLGGLPGSADPIEHDARIIVICQSGRRSVSAAKRLLKSGFTDVSNVAGGTSAWRGKLER
jgi:rhodanese-related sulfurtransferase